jgi:hypothetical protein
LAVFPVLFYYTLLGWLVLLFWGAFCCTGANLVEYWYRLWIIVHFSTVQL